MKYILPIALALFASASIACEEKKKEVVPETKRVCVMQKDQKTQVEKEVCRVIKVHKKLEGTKVPEKK
jgi:hypothetical protein